MLDDVPRPEVTEDEVLVGVRAASVHPDVWHVLRGRPYFLRLMGNGVLKPKNKIPGTDMAGIVESVGTAVTDSFRPGDQVFGECVRGHQWKNGGAFAEFVSVPATALASKPEEVTFEQAAVVPTSGLIALANLRGAGLRSGQQVLVNGAGGGVGSLALQIAKAYGANVTAVDTTSKLGLLSALGADRVIDYTADDFTRESERYDVVFDVPGNHSTADLERTLSDEGVYVLIGHDDFGRSAGRWLGSIRQFLKVQGSALGRRKPPAESDIPKDDRMGTLAGLLASGDLTPHVDRTYPLDGLDEAIRELEEGQVLGRSVIVI